METALQTQYPGFAKWFPLGRQKRFQAELAWAKSQLQANGVGDAANAVDGSVLGMLRQAQQTHDLCEDEVIEEVLTIGGAGHETTANTLSWCLMLLAQNPEVQQQLCRELRTKVKGDFPTYDEAHALDFARCCVCVSILSRCSEGSAWTVASALTLILPNESRRCVAASGMRS
jgi:cytochrome P450